jgi:riboflavin kinase/FMN adenylyltransferase
MEVYHSLENAPAVAGSAIALGNFDGVHLGHRALIAEAERHGRASVLTFDPHPAKVLQPDMGPRLIEPLDRRLERLAELGLSACVVQTFTLEYARTPAEDFERLLLDRARPAHVVVGHDFTYGTKRSGDVERLRAACERRGIGLHVIAPVTIDGLVVSSTKIREYLLAGRVAPAARLLGRPFELDGKVVEGKRRGRQLGFPTANLAVQGEITPASGIYATRARVRGEARAYAGAASVGFNPTFGDTGFTLEVYLLDFEGELYGKTLRVEFLERLRPELRFDSVEALKAQIARDVEQTRRLVPV